MDSSLTTTDTMLRTPFFFQVEPPRTMRVEGFEWEQELRIALPASYARSERSYPVLWVTDNMLEAALNILGFHFGGTELIIVAVGPPVVSMDEYARRRTYEFYPGPDPFPPGLGGEVLSRELGAAFEGASGWVGGGAGRFLDFLVDEARPALAAEYRMDPDDHCLLGYSAGGTFVGFSLFARPGAFAKYICGSPALYASNGAVFELEEAYATEHDDLRADVFFGAGDAEITEPLIPAYGIVSGMARLAETLSLRGYPSLRMTVKIFPGETHSTALHGIVGWGVRSLWGDKVFAAK